jgi:hypothetical protein
MMEALIYGIMPRAKTESLSRAPPENMSKSPNKVPRAEAKKVASASPSIPGVGTAQPIRYTSKSPKVHRTRLFNSGILKTF